MSRIHTSKNLNDTFTVNSTPCADPGFDQRILVQFSFEGFNYDAATLAQKPWVRILSPQGTEIFFQRFSPNEGNNTSPTVGGFYKKLSPGTYTLEAFGTFNTSNPAGLPPNYASINSNFQNPTTLKTKEYAGGLRIRKIVEKESDSDPKPRIRQYYYNPEGDNIHSSGVIYQEPRYEYGGIEYDNITSGTPTFCTENITQLSYVLRMSQNVTSLGTTQGSHIGYREVSVVYGENNFNGRSIFKFSSPVEFADEIPQELPFAPATSTSYATGLLKEQSDYVYNGSTNRIAKKIINEYFTRVSSIPGLKLATSVKLDCAIGSCCMEYFIYGPYATVLGHTQIKKIIETTYDSEGFNTTLTTQNEFEYDAELQNLKKQTFTNSTGSKQITEMYYPREYLIPTTVINDMKIKNMVGLPLETIVKKIDESNNVWVLSGKYNQYGNISNKIRLTSNYTIKTPVGLPIASYNYSVSNSNMDGRYTKDFDFVYESGAGNMVEFTKLNDLPTSILWGHANTLPIAKVIGSNYSTVSSAYNAVGGNLSALRSHSSLANAFVSTYSYKPLTGMTSETDPNGKIVWYEYDALNRLSLVRDHDNNITKKICYNYAGQAIQCGDQVFTNTVQSGSFTKNDCPAGQSGSTVTYTIAAGTVNSYVSIADANQQAQLLIQQQGQAYANANGTCTPTANCTYASCESMGLQYKCIDDVCYYGYAVNYGVNPYNSNECMWRYEWFDGSFSGWYYTPSSGGSCMLDY